MAWWWLIGIVLGAFWIYACVHDENYDDLAWSVVAVVLFFGVKMFQSEEQANSSGLMVVGLLLGYLYGKRVGWGGDRPPDRQYRYCSGCSKKVRATRTPALGKRQYQITCTECRRVWQEEKTWFEGPEGALQWLAWFALYAAIFGFSLVLSQFL